MKFVINRKSEGGYQFFLKNSADRPVLWSPRFETKTECKDGIAVLKRQVTGHVEFDKWQTDSGRYVFHLRNKEGHLLAMSSPFGSKGECVRHIYEVQQKVPVAGEEDLSF